MVFYVWSFIAGRTETKHNQSFGWFDTKFDLALVPIQIEHRFNSESNESSLTSNIWTYSSAWENKKTGKSFRIWAKNGINFKCQANNAQFAKSFVCHQSSLGTACASFLNEIKFQFSIHGKSKFIYNRENLATIFYKNVHLKCVFDRSALRCIFSSQGWKYRTTIIE